MTFSITLAGEADETTERKLLDELRALKKKYQGIAYARIHGSHVGIIHMDASGELGQEDLEKSKAKGGK